MNLEICAIYNSDTRMYDVVVCNKKVSVEVICSCKTFENAEWIVDLINNERCV